MLLDEKLLMKQKRQEKIQYYKQLQVPLCNFFNVVDIKKHKCTYIDDSVLQELVKHNQKLGNAKQEKKNK